MLIRLIKASSVAVMLLLAGCGGEPQEGHVISHNVQAKNEDKLLRANRYLIRKDMEMIKGYISRHDLSMVFADLGYYYSVVERGSGGGITKGKVVLFSYRINLIDGTPIDSSGTELSQVVVDKSQAITGIHDGLKKLHEGDSAIFIFPPHVAYGLLGDGVKIPRRSTLVYSIKVKSVK